MCTSQPEARCMCTSQPEARCMCMSRPEARYACDMPRVYVREWGVCAGLDRACVQACLWPDYVQACLRPDYVQA